VHADSVGYEAIVCGRPDGQYCTGGRDRRSPRPRSGPYDDGGPADRQL